MNNVEVENAQGTAPHQVSTPRLAQQHSDGDERGKEKWSKETYIALLATLGLFAHLTARFGLHTSTLQYNLPLILILLIGGSATIVRPSSEDGPARVRLRPPRRLVDHGVRRFRRIFGRVNCRSHALRWNGAGALRNEARLRRSCRTRKA